MNAHQNPATMPETEKAPERHADAATHAPDRDAILKAFFSDESEAFRSPCEPGLGEHVTVRLRVEKGIDARVALLVGKKLRHVRLEKAREDELFSWYEATLSCGLDPFNYRIAIACPQGRAVYQRGGAHWVKMFSADVHQPHDDESEGNKDAHAVTDGIKASARDFSTDWAVVSTDAHADGDASGELASAARDEDEWWAFAKTSSSKMDFRVTPGFHVPTWAQGALQYQIFPDRFANGNPGNDVVAREYAYNNGLVKIAESWDALPQEDDYRCFYGGDLQGVASKLDYLQSLGVEAIYLNPIFVSPSSHKYDTQDYEHIDPHFAVISLDEGKVLPEQARSNDGATRYACRTTEQVNLRLSDEYFARFCQEVHGRGMRIILDGVFNHCGSFSKWMDREGIYAHSGRFDSGAFQAPDSPYRHYFGFEEDSTTVYEGWWGHPTLPKLNYEKAPDLVDRIIDIARKWAMPPYSIDGWRLDVAADLGHSSKYNHAFWRKFRDALKRVNPELLIVAEHYGNVSPWLGGDQWDTVMNYDAFMDPLTYFLTGMEKHSDRKRDDLYQDGEAFWEAMRECMARFGWGSLLCAMNELSNHDHSRFLTRTNRQVGRTETVGPEAANEGVDKRVLRQAVLVQMTWPGAPTIYYGDEAGVAGWTDPDCRRTYPWGNEDVQLIEFHRELAGLRKRHPSLRAGSFVPLGGGQGWIAFGRFCGDDRVVVACNAGKSACEVALHVRALGAKDGSSIVSLLRTTPTGFSTAEKVLAEVADGACRITVPAHSAFAACVR